MGVRGLAAAVLLVTGPCTAFVTQPSAWLAGVWATRGAAVAAPYTTALYMSSKDESSDKDKDKRHELAGLPLSYRSDNGTRDNEFSVEEWEADGPKNPYFDVVRRLSPSEHIQRFMTVTPPRVQDAVRTTVMGLLGTLPRHAFETTALSTGSALANLMFQLQMTGYMFKNAEYRLSLQNSLQTAPGLIGSSPVAGFLTGSKDAEGEDGGSGSGGTLSAVLPLDDDGNIVLKKPKVTGMVKLTYENGQEVEVDAGAYMNELATQVESLQNQLSRTQTQAAEAQSKDLLLYLKNMPESQLKGLTAGISPDVLESMKLLVETVMRSMGAGAIGGATITQQSGAGMAQLVMWQLAVGYSLREMEAREEIRARFEAAETD